MLKHGGWERWCSTSLNQLIRIQYSLLIIHAATLPGYNSNTNGAIVFEKMSRQFHVHVYKYNLISGFCYTWHTSWFIIPPLSPADRHPFPLCTVTSSIAISPVQLLPTTPSNTSWNWDFTTEAGNFTWADIHLSPWSPVIVHRAGLSDPPTWWYEAI